MDDHVCMYVEVYARMMLVQSNVSIESTAQVKGTTEMMVTVVATQKLKRGDWLLRFKAEAEPRRGNSNDRYMIYIYTLYIHIFFKHLNIVLPRIGPSRFVAFL